MKKIKPIKALILLSVVFTSLAMTCLWAIYNMQVDILCPAIMGIVSLFMVAIFCQLIELEVRKPKTRFKLTKN